MLRQVATNPGGCRTISILTGHMGLSQPFPRKTGKLLLLLLDLLGTVKGEPLVACGHITPQAPRNAALLWPCVLAGPASRWDLCPSPAAA